MHHGRSPSGLGVQHAIVSLAICGLVAAGASQAQARAHHHHAERHHSESRYEPPSAAIVVDANSGKVLHASNPDSLRHPASLTKIMTLYLLFEQLEAGKLKLDSRLAVSAHAAAQEPTKLDLHSGQSIQVEDAIKAIVTKSANDVAVVIAEAIGGDERSFAQLMTHKAHALGMTRTVYANASGLPDDEQVTTARDQALLGRAIQDRFPGYYRYFATRSFHFHGMSIGNHNHLLGQVEGVDGIKTGYTRASGFNLVTSLRRRNRHIVAAVFGGSSAGARDAKMRALIEEHLNEASNQRTVPMIVEAIESGPARVNTPVAAAGAPLRGHKGGATPKMHAEVAPAAAITAPRTSPGSTNPIEPIPVKTIAVRAGSVQTPALSSLVAPALQASVAPPHWAASASAAQFPPTAPSSAALPQAAAPRSDASASPTAQATSPAPVASTRSATPGPGQTESPPSAEPAPATAAMPPGLAQLAARNPGEPATFARLQPSPIAESGSTPPAAGILGTLRLRTASAESASDTGSAPWRGAMRTPQTAGPHTGWMIQLGAFADESEAKQRLRSAQSMAQNLLGNADAFTERVVKGSKELYRARFAGFDKEKAEAACHYFKRNDIACMALKN